MQKIRCLLVDDEPLALDALATLIGKIPDLEVIGRCPDAVEALVYHGGPMQQVRGRSPDFA